MNNIKRREQLKEMGISVADNISDEELEKLTDEEINVLIQKGYSVEINSKNAVDSDKDAELFFDDIDENKYLLTDEYKGIGIDYKTKKTVRLKRGSYGELFIKQLKDGLQKHQQNQDAIHTQIQDIIYNGCKGFKAVGEANTYIKLDEKDTAIKKIITTNHKFLYHENSNIVISSAPIIFGQLTNSRIEGNSQLKDSTTGNDFNSIFVQFEKILNKKPDAQIESVFNSGGHYQSATMFKKDGKIYMKLIDPFYKDKITEYEIVKNKDGIYDTTSLKNPKTYNNPDYKDYIVDIDQQREGFSCGFHSVALLLDKTRINLKKQLQDKNISKEQREKIEYDIKILEETLEETKIEFKKLYGKVKQEEVNKKDKNITTISMNRKIESKGKSTNAKINKQELNVNNIKKEKLDKNTLGVLVNNKLEKINSANVGYINNLLDKQEETDKYNEQYDYDNMSEQTIYQETDRLLKNDDLVNNYVLWDRLFKLLKMQDDMISCERSKVNKKNDNKTKTIKL